MTARLGRVAVVNPLRKARPIQRAPARAAPRPPTPPSTAPCRSCPDDQRPASTQSSRVGAIADESTSAHPTLRILQQQGRCPCRPPQSGSRNRRCAAVPDEQFFLRSGTAAATDVEHIEHQLGVKSTLDASHKGLSGHRERGRRQHVVQQLEQLCLRYR